MPFAHCTLSVLVVCWLCCFRIWDTRKTHPKDSLDWTTLKQLIFQNSSQLTQELASESELWGNKLKGQLQNLDWNKLKDSLQLSDKEWIEYGESLKFLDDDRGGDKPQISKNSTAQEPPKVEKLNLEQPDAQQRNSVHYPEILRMIPPV